MFDGEDSGLFDGMDHRGARGVKHDGRGSPLTFRNLLKRHNKDQNSTYLMSEHTATTGGGDRQIDGSNRFSPVN